MRKRHYDDYDYEEAYRKQIENLEEWELERLMKDGKVECLYRTTTTKSTNIKSGTTLLSAIFRMKGSKEHPKLIANSVFKFDVAF